MLSGVGSKIGDWAGKAGSAIASGASSAWSAISSFAMSNPITAGIGAILAGGGIAGKFSGSDTAASKWDKKTRELKKHYEKRSKEIFEDFEIGIGSETLPNLSDLVDDERVRKKTYDAGDWNWNTSDRYNNVLNLPEYKDALEEMEKKIQNEILPKLNNIFGNIKSGLNSAFSADTYGGFMSSFGSSLKDTITSNLKEAFLQSKAIKPLMKELTGSIYKATQDGALDQAEKKRIKEDYENITDESKGFFEGLKDIEEELDMDLGISGDTSYSSSSSSGGSQVSEITGETRNLFEDLLTPLANFPSLISINERIYDQLSKIRQNMGGAVAGNKDISVRVDNINVDAQGQSVSNVTAAEVERIVTQALKNGRRGQGI